ncbi:replication-associated recombination protein A [Aliikangiella maris]|uniref:Replication-associated recombination protein A n=2 Tax=Aliikangiella maris TaxID=3162458 RepID=A0ABV2BZ73_9GAMM
MADLFDSQPNDTAQIAEVDLSQPLAARMRPTQLEDYAGQNHLFEPGKPLFEAITRGKLHSMIFWGPSGTGKTTLARLIAKNSDCYFIAISAVLGSVKDIRLAVEQAKLKRQMGQQTLLFVDEVHRFNKSQQDAFLPYVEDGTFIFVGATTENPSFEVNNALLSRARVYVLNALNQSALTKILQRALTDSDAGLGKLNLSMSDEAQSLLLDIADGDARRLLNLLEMAVSLLELSSKSSNIIDRTIIEQLLGESIRRFDKGGEAFYDQISALHKSVRGSNPDAALYWFCRMLDGGCDPLYIARRVVRMASEDIGNADPRGLQLAINAWDVQTRLGSPEGELAIAQAIVYLAVAAKSNAVYSAFKAAMADIKGEPSYPVPLHLRNAPTQLMKSLEYGAEYRYDHNESNGFAAGQQYFPDDKAPVDYYQPVERGMEKQIAEKLQYLRTLNQKESI